MGDMRGVYGYLISPQQKNKQKRFFQTDKRKSFRRRSWRRRGDGTKAGFFDRNGAKRIIPRLESERSLSEIKIKKKIRNFVKEKKKGKVPLKRPCQCRCPPRNIPRNLLIQLYQCKFQQLRFGPCPLSRIAPSAGSRSASL